MERRRSSTAKAMGFGTGRNSAFVFGYSVHFSFHDFSFRVLEATILLVEILALKCVWLACFRAKALCLEARFIFCYTPPACSFMHVRSGEVMSCTLEREQQQKKEL